MNCVLARMTSTKNSRVRTKAGNVANFQLCNPLLPWEMRRSDAQITNAEVAAILMACSKM